MAQLKPMPPKRLMDACADGQAGLVLNAELDAVEAFVLLSPEVFVEDAVAEVGSPVFADVSDGESEGSVLVPSAEEGGLGLQGEREEE